MAQTQTEPRAVADLSNYQVAGLAAILADVLAHIKEGRYNADAGVWTLLSLIRHAGGWNRVRGCLTGGEVQQLHDMRLYRYMPGIMDED